jgi:hypothetical protein
MRELETSAVAAAIRREWAAAEVWEVHQVRSTGLRHMTSRIDSQKFL